MQVPSLNNIPKSIPADHYLDNLPKGMLKRRNSKDLSLDLELCSFDILDSSKIKKISLWHRFSNQMGVLGTDILILNGKEIKATPELDYLGGRIRCLGNETDSGVAYFLDSKMKAISNITKILLSIHLITPTWLSRASLREVAPKFENFTQIPSVRGLKKMQYEAQYLYNSSVKGSSFSEFLALLFKNTLQFEQCSLSKLQCLATHEIATFKEQMSSPRDGEASELTNPYKYMKEHEKRLISHIKKVARNRIFWGHRTDDFFKGDPAYKGTIAYMFKNYFELEIIEQMAAYD